MKINVICRSEGRRNTINFCANFYSKILKLKNSRYTVYIRSVRDLRTSKECNGVVFQTGTKEICMLLESRLSITRLMMTIAHEMVHVKQIAKGQYRGKLSRNGHILSCWRGKTIRTDYLNRPWEKEAFSREGLLVEALIKYVAKKTKKVDNK